MYYCVSKDGIEYKSGSKPIRADGINTWSSFQLQDIPEGSIKDITGVKLTWEDEPYEQRTD